MSMVCLLLLYLLSFVRKQFNKSRPGGVMTNQTDGTVCNDDVFQTIEIFEIIAILHIA